MREEFLKEALWQCQHCNAWIEPSINACVSCGAVRPYSAVDFSGEDLLECYLCSERILRESMSFCPGCGAKLDDIGWDLVYSYNGLQPKTSLGSHLDDQYCMRCGADRSACDCSYAITEHTFSEFMSAYGAYETDIYDQPYDFVRESCFDCQYQSMPECKKLIEYIHTVLKDYPPTKRINEFPKITMCSDFKSLYAESYTGRTD